MRLERGLCVPDTSMKTICLNSYGCHECFEQNQWDYYTHFFPNMNFPSEVCSTCRDNFEINWKNDTGCTRVDNDRCLYGQYRRHDMWCITRDECHGDVNEMIYEGVNGQEGRCGCKPTFVYDSGVGACVCPSNLPIIEHGKRCIAQSECKASENEVYSASDLTCVCKNGFEYRNNQCVFSGLCKGVKDTIRHGQECITASECLATAHEEIISYGHIAGLPDSCECL